MGTKCKCSDQYSGDSGNENGYLRQINITKVKSQSLEIVDSDADTLVLPQVGGYSDELVCGCACLDANEIDIVITINSPIVHASLCTSEHTIGSNSKI